MNRFKGLIRDTWWAWLTIFAFGVVGGLVLSRIFYSAVPIGIFAFFYFGMMRYDEEGEPKEL